MPRTQNSRPLLDSKTRCGLFIPVEVVWIAVVDEDHSLRIPRDQVKVGGERLPVLLFLLCLEALVAEWDGALSPGGFWEAIQLTFFSSQNLAQNQVQVMFGVLRHA